MNKRNTRTIIFSILALAIIIFLLSFSLIEKKTPNSQLVLLNGEKRMMQDFLGKVLLVNFWATSCTTCVAEMPDLVALHQKFESHGFETIAVAMQYDPPSYVVNFAQTRQLPFQIVIDNTGAIAKEWGNVTITPTTFIINKKGVIVKSFVGKPNPQKLSELIANLVAE